MMHFPINIHIGHSEIKSHLVFELLAYTAGFQCYRYLRSKRQDAVSEGQRTWVIMGAALGAAIGSKLLGFLEHPELWRLVRQNLLYGTAAKTIVGGLLGGLIGVELAKKCLGMTRSTGDLFTYPIILAISIGRIGCFLAGVEDGTSGNPTSSIFGIDMGDGIARHPAQLYEITALGMLALGLRVLQRHFVLKAGALFKLFLSSYLLWRLLIEFIKPVHIVGATGLSAIQLACVAGLLYYWRVFFQPRSLFARVWSPANTFITS